MAFSKEVRQEIGDRDQGNLGSTGYEFEQWHASHIDHNKADDHYNEPSNGTRVNRPTHYLQHALGADHGFQYNEWAAQKLYEGLNADEIAYLEYLELIG